MMQKPILVLKSPMDIAVSPGGSATPQLMVGGKDKPGWGELARRGFMGRDAGGAKISPWQQTRAIGGMGGKLFAGAGAALGGMYGLADASQSGSGAGVLNAPIGVAANYAALDPSHRIAGKEKRLHLQLTIMFRLVLIMIQETWCKQQRQRINPLPKRRKVRPLPLLPLLPLNLLPLHHNPPIQYPEWSGHLKILKHLSKHPMQQLTLLMLRRIKNYKRHRLVNGGRILIQIARLQKHRQPLSNHK